MQLVELSRDRVLLLHARFASEINVTSQWGFIFFANEHERRPGSTTSLFASLNTLGPHNRVGWGPLRSVPHQSGKTLTFTYDEHSFRPGPLVIAVACS